MYEVKKLLLGIELPDRQHSDLLDTPRTVFDISYVTTRVSNWVLETAKAVPTRHAAFIRPPFGVSVKELLVLMESGEAPGNPCRSGRGPGN
ncbi:hypothetical protein P3T35_000483 [Kitasatospora sp. GP30]|uniref:hypothetical protein n=1 Tax=Kitasatospora sp. GP30 TaxID=3035084 RepID=UPI000C710673|nr:hypothetical protein [Kitasatospora sp. GP30]MDH6138506.1 hypothetical protein [Kitasatospora sp. GP30]